MKRLLYILAIAAAALALIGAAPSHADKKIVPVRPNLDSIRMEVNNPKSPYYYPKLMARYEQNETVMNLRDYRHLYYGYLFQEDFNPYRHSYAAGKADSLYYKTKHTRAELDSIMAYAYQALQDNPFDLGQMNFLIYALRKRGKTNMANIWQYRLNHLLEAIVSSGTGMDKENAWYVINPRHEYNILNFMNAVATNQAYEEPFFDRIDTERRLGNHVEQNTYYFNIRNLLEEYYRKFPEPQATVEEEPQPAAEEYVPDPRYYESLTAKEEPTTSAGAPAAEVETPESQTTEAETPEP